MTDESILAFFRRCPKLSEISISGNDKVKGKITGKTALTELKKDKALAKQLRVLGLVDQMWLDTKVLKALSKARKGLTIKEGESSEKWYDLGGVNIWKGGELDLGYDSLEFMGGFRGRFRGVLW